MEAKRRPRDVGKKVNMKHLIFKEMLVFLVVKPMFLMVRTSVLKRQIDRNRANIGIQLREEDSGKQDATRRTAGSTRRGPEARANT